MDSGTTKTSATQRLIAAIEKIGTKSLASGNFGWFVLMVIAVTISWKLDSKDLKEIFLAIIARYGWLGYVVATVTVFLSVKILNWRERIHQAEVDRLCVIRDRLIQPQLEIPPQSSARGKTPQ